jgi:outer membrane protein TolC
VSRTALFAVVASCLTAPALAQSTGLTVEEAVRLALARNERARQAELVTAQAEARVSRARAFFFPDLLAEGTYTRRAHETVRMVGGSDVTLQSRNAFGGTLTATLTLFDARSVPLYRQAKRLHEAARFNEAEDKRVLSFEAADAFLQTLGREQVVKAAERRLEFARATQADARARVEAGLTGSNDATRAELEVATAERALLNARGDRDASSLQLGFLLDTPVTAPLVRPEALLAQATAPVAPDRVEPLVLEAQKRRLDLKARRAEAQAARHAAHEPDLRVLPSLSALGQYRVTNEAGFSGRQSDWFVALTLSWMLYDGGERYAVGRELDAAARAAALTVSAQERGVALAVRTAAIQLGTAQASLHQARAAAESARKNAQESAVLYRQGLARALELADANASLFEAEVGLASAEYGLALAFLGLRSALGPDPFGREVTP